MGCADDFALTEDHQLTIAASGNADVGIPGFAGAIDRTSHNGDFSQIGHFSLRFEFIYNVFHDRRELDQIDFSSAAGGAGNDFRHGLPDAAGFEDLPGGIDFGKRRSGQADPDGVTDPVGQQCA